jgi:hypothetical protein
MNVKLFQERLMVFCATCTLSNCADWPSSIFPAICANALQTFHDVKQ